MEEPHKEVSLTKKKMKKRHFDLKLPDYIRIDWRRPKCYCKEACHCSNFTCRMTYTPPDAPVARAIDTKEEEGIDWTSLLNIDLLNLTWRIARISDFDSIFRLVDENTKSMFEIDELGSKLLHLIEHSFYFLVAVNFQGVIVGAISVNDTPPLCYIAPAEWDSWLQGMFGLYKFGCRNTLWVHFLAYTKRYKHVVFHILLVPIFLRCRLLTKLAIYVPPKVKVRKKWICYFERVGTTVKPGPEESHMSIDSDSDEYPTNIYCVSRNRFLEPLELRKATKEDEDALSKTLEKDHKKLLKRYGANYVNTFITEKRYATFLASTADSKEQPAIIVMKADFDVEYIRDKFEIYAFNNFKKNKATDYLMQPEKRYISAVSQEMVEVSDVLNGEEVRRPHEQDDKDEAEEKEEKDDEEGEPTVIEGLTWTNFLMTGTQDSDEEEGRGMDRIICTDNPIDKITYKNLCMSMSSSNVAKDFKASMVSRKTQGTVSLSFEVDGNFDVITVEYINMGAEPITSVKTLFLKILDNFPTYEYIILKIPRKARHPECITHMMRVFPVGHKNWLYFDEDLYLFHRWFASGLAECRKAEKTDFQMLLNVLCMENSSEEIQQELFSSLFDQEQRSTAVAFMVNKKIVGTAIICPEREMEFYKFHYDLEKHMVPSLHNQSEIGYVKHMVINGLHEFSTRDFVRGFMQFMGWKSVFFTRYPQYIHEQITDFSLPSGLRHFVPVRPRRVPVYAPSLHGRVPPYHLRNDYPPFALYYLNYRLSSFQKRINHTKIVVVGTGETGLAFLENFFFRSASETELFTEVVVITKHHAPFAYPRRVRINRRKKSGMAPIPKAEDLYATWLSIMKERLDKSKRPYDRSVTQKLESILRMYSGGLSDQKSREDSMYETTFKSIAERMLPRMGCYTSKYVCKLGLESWTNVVEGTMTAIHRDEKCVEVDGKKMIPYDYLFLFCGKQFSTPQADHRNIVLGKECKALYDLKTPWIRRVSLKPRNLFTINCLSDASHALQYIKRLNPGRGQIVVYGSCVNCLSCIEALLQFGVIPSRIAFVESDLNAPYAIDYFNDPVVYKAIRRKMFDIGISHYFYYNFVNWDYSEATQLITKAHFESESKMASLKCLALFSFTPKEIGHETLLSYTESNLVYDGGLVIDADFRTNDPYIYAAGPGTRYKKKYFADHYFHEHYNATEVGEEMAERAFMIIPNLPHNKLETKQDIIDFKKPVITACCIPGNKHLLMVRRPGPIVPLEVLINQLDFGSILVTGNPNIEDSKEPEYFKIILNNQNFIIDIICLSSIPIDIDNIVQLYGRHEKMLNSMLLRYRSHVIMDFYEFFKEPWAYLFYHDRFDCLMEQMRGQFYVKLPLSDKTFADLIAEGLKRSNWTQLPQSAMRLLEEIFLSFPELKKKMADDILAFFNDNRNHLPMALNDDFTRSVLQIAGENMIYIHNAHRAGGKPLVSKPYSFEKHKKMYQPKEYYERIE